MANWIPPVPLSMKDGGIYHFVKKNPSEGTYTVKYYRDWFLKFWDNSDNVYHWASGDTVFCYASIFAPIDWEATVYYQWRKYDPGQEKWNDRDRLSYAISGGRKGGYRGFTYKRNIDEGEWRVDIETEYGQVLGRIEFDVVASEAADRKEIIATK